MTDNKGNVIDWTKEYNRLSGGLLFLLTRGLLTQAEFGTINEAAEKLIRHIFGPRKSQVAELDEVGICWHGYEMVVTLSGIKSSAAFYFDGFPLTESMRRLSDRLNPRYPRCGEDLFDIMHINAEKVRLPIKCSPKHNPSGVDISNVGRIFFDVIGKINPKLLVWDAEGAFSDWVRAFGNPLMGEESRSALVPEIVSAYKTYREKMIELARCMREYEDELDAKARSENIHETGLQMDDELALDEWYEDIVDDLIEAMQYAGNFFDVCEVIKRGLEHATNILDPLVFSYDWMKAALEEICCREDIQTEYDRVRTAKVMAVLVERSLSWATAQLKETPINVKSVIDWLIERFGNVPKKDLEDECQKIFIERDQDGDGWHFSGEFIEGIRDNIEETKTEYFQCRYAQLRKEVGLLDEDVFSKTNPYKKLSDDVERILADSPSPARYILICTFLKKAIGDLTRKKDRDLPRYNWFFRALYGLTETPIVLKDNDDRKMARAFVSVLKAFDQWVERLHITIGADYEEDCVIWDLYGFKNRQDPIVYLFKRQAVSGKTVYDSEPFEGVLQGLREAMHPRYYKEMRQCSYACERIENGSLRDDANPDERNVGKIEIHEDNGMKEKNAANSGVKIINNGNMQIGSKGDMQIGSPGSSQHQTRTVEKNQVIGVKSSIWDKLFWPILSSVIAGVIVGLIMLAVKNQWFKNGV